MTTCIRCSAEVTVLPGEKLLSTADGSVTCPASGPGEAAIHRTEQAPVAWKRQRSTSLLDVLIKAGGLFAVYKGSEFIGREMTGGNHHQQQDRPGYIDGMPTGWLGNYSHDNNGNIQF